MSRPTTLMEKALVGLLITTMYKLRKSKKENETLKNEIEKYDNEPIIDINLPKLPLKWPWQKPSVNKPRK